MACQHCNGTRVLRVNAKTSDMFTARMSGIDYDGYVPRDIGIGGGDYIDFKYCLDCGRIQGTFPLPVTELEGGDE